MNTIAATQISLPFTAIFFPRSIKANSRNKSTVCFCDSDDGSQSNPSSSPSEGDKRKQELLARIAMLQTQKVRLTDFLDERSAYLTQFAEDANSEFDQIGESALKELEEASARIMENLESRLQDYDESAEINRQEIEKSEKLLEDFEEKIERDRNEGLFFKNLRDKKEQNKNVEAKAEAKKIVELNKQNAGSGTRKNIYLLLMGLLGVGITTSVISSPEVEWKRVVALVLIFLALLAQYIYELKLKLTDLNALHCTYDTLINTTIACCFQNKTKLLHRAE